MSGIGSTIGVVICAIFWWKFLGGWNIGVVSFQGLMVAIVGSVLGGLGETIFKLVNETEVKNKPNEPSKSNSHKPDDEYIVETKSSKDYKCPKCDHSYGWWNGIQCSYCGWSNDTLSFTDKGLKKQINTEHENSTKALSSISDEEFVHVKNLVFEGQCSEAILFLQEKAGCTFFDALAIIQKTRKYPCD